MSRNNVNVCKAIMARELGGRRPGTATGQCRRLYQSFFPTNKVQQMEVPDAHICRFSPCGNYLVCLGGGFTQLVVYRFTGPRVSWQGELSEAEIASRLTSFSCFFSLLYRVPLAPVREVIARDVVLFMAGGSLLLLVSHSPFTAPAAQPAPDADPLQALPYAESITLHLVRLSDGVRVGGSRLERELVDLTGRPGNLGISVHEDLIAVLALRSQVVHLLQVLRGGEEVVPVRSLGPYVAEDDELVLRIAAEAEERWRRARRAEREREEEAAASAAQRPPLRRCFNGDLVRTADVDTAQPSAVAAASSSGPARHHSTRPLAAEAAGQIEGVERWSHGPSPLPPRPGGLVPGLGLGPGEGAGLMSRQDGTAASTAGEVLQDGSSWDAVPGAAPQAAVNAAVSRDNASGRGVRAESDSDSAAMLRPPPISILYPPEGFRMDRGATAGVAPTDGPRGRAAPAADLAAAAAHQANVRRQMRQQQYEQLAAQGGPRHPQQARRNVPEDGTVSVASNPSQTGRDAAGTIGVPRAPHHHQQPNNLLPAPSPPLPQQQQFPAPPRQSHHHHQNRHHHQPQNPGASHHTAPRQMPVQQQPLGPGQAARGRVLLQPSGGGEGAGGSTSNGGCIMGIKQRLLAHLYVNCRKLYPNNPRRQQREALALFRHLDTYRSLLMRKVYLLDRSRLLIDMRKPVASELGHSVFGGGGAPASGGGLGQAPSQFFLLFDLRTTRVLGFEASPGDKVIEAYLREVTSAAVEPWAESLPLWDRYVYDNVVTDVRSKLRGGPGGALGGIMSPGFLPRSTGGGDGIGTGIGAGRIPTAVSGGGGAAAVAAERASCAGKLMQLLPPLSGSCALSSSPYLDTLLFDYDERVVSPYIRTRPCLEQSIFFRLRNRLDRAVFRLDPGPYDAMVVRDRHLARNVTYLFHPDAPLVMAVFGVFQQNTVNINFRL